MFCLTQLSQKKDIIEWLIWMIYYVIIKVTTTIKVWFIKMIEFELQKYNNVCDKYVI